MMTEQQQGDARAAFKQRLQGTHPLLKELMAGGAAGGFAKSAVAPLERVKIIIQTSPSRAPILTILKDIVTSEGTKGLWKGNGASVLRVVPYAALHFSAYERYRTRLLEFGEGTIIGRSPFVDLFAGAMAGATAVIATYPLDLLRTRLAWRTSGINKQQQAASGKAGIVAGKVVTTTTTGVVTRPQSSMFSVLNGLARREGVTGLYKGVGPTLLGIFPYAGLKFFVYQYLKGLYVQSKIEEHQQQQQEEGDNTIHLHLAPDQIHIGTHLKLCFGACAGLIAQTVTYPLDVVRRRMQVQDLMLAGGAKASTNSNSNRKNGMEVHIRNSWHGLRTIYSTMGIRKGLYAGLSLNYLKVVPSTAIGFAVYDSAKEYLNHKTSI